MSNARKPAQTSGRDAALDGSGATLQSPGSPLDAGVRTQLEPRFGYDFSHVRVHADARAASSAESLQARAYCVGNHIVFGSGEFAPATEAGMRLLAHELTHVVQQAHGGSGRDAESNARTSAEAALHGQPVSSPGGAPVGLYRQGREEGDKPQPASAKPTVHLDWSQFPPALRPPGLRSPAAGLTPPSILSPAPTPSFLGLQYSTAPRPQTSFTPQLGDWRASLGLNALKPPPGPGLPPKGPSSSPPPAPTYNPKTAALPSDPPSRIPVTTVGDFSLGLKLGLPGVDSSPAGTPPARQGAPPFGVPGASPTYNQQVIYQAEIMDQQFTGKVPTGWDAVDKSQLAKVIWGIFSTHIAPQWAQSLVSKVSGPPGVLNELNLVLNGDFKGAGVSLTITSD